MLCSIACRSKKKKKKIEVESTFEILELFRAERREGHYCGLRYLLFLNVRYVIS